MCALQRSTGSRRVSCRVQRSCFFPRNRLLGPGRVPSSLLGRVSDLWPGGISSFSPGRKLLQRSERKRTDLPSQFSLPTGLFPNFFFVSVFSRPLLFLLYRRREEAQAKQASPAASPMSSPEPKPLPLPIPIPRKPLVTQWLAMSFRPAQQHQKFNSRLPKSDCVRGSYRVTALRTRSLCHERDCMRCRVPVENYRCVGSDTKTGEY